MYAGQNSYKSKPINNSNKVNENPINVKAMHITNSLPYPVQSFPICSIKKWINVFLNSAENKKSIPKTTKIKIYIVRNSFEL